MRLTVCTMNNNTLMEAQTQARRYIYSHRSPSPPPTTALECVLIDSVATHGTVTTSPDTHHGDIPYAGIDQKTAAVADILPHGGSIGP